VDGSDHYLGRAGLRVDRTLAEFLEADGLPAAGVSADIFWTGLARMVQELAPRNRALLAERQRMQDAIDDWHVHNGAGDADDYEAFLVEIGYLLPEGPSFEIDTTGVDAEIAEVAGPQLVVPASNARYLLNAANARWGSLYDALYGTDALGSKPPSGGYDAARGGRVIAWVRDLLDEVVPLRGGKHAAALGYLVRDGRLVVTQPTGTEARLADSAMFAGYTGPPQHPSSVVLIQHGLGIELILDATTPVGSTDPAGLSDVLLESAVSTIVDLEDSIAAVDGADKALAYRNWLGLMTGTLTEQVSKEGRTFTRRLQDDREVTGPDGQLRSLRGRALLLVRTVGHLMSTPAVLDGPGNEIPEGLLDTLVTVTLAQADRGGANSRSRSVYLVKPKMHGPSEVAFAVQTCGMVEQLLGLEPNTVKIGIMDEERRTTVNLMECIRAGRSRLAFINTGFLDRTGDEIHTGMRAGAMVRKAEMKRQRWIEAYENWNVEVGLACGLRGRAQIGKGMWAAPDLMADLLADKIGQPRAGASCAWVPSPTAATLHATHYHRVDVGQVQAALAVTGRRARLAELLTIPLAGTPSWTPEEIRDELHNNVQGILGYVVRWVDQGIGCSKVPDIHDVGLMEDRATCRISAQHLANWLQHGILTRAEVEDALRRMAIVVDSQNVGDPAYRPMAPSFDGEAFLAARELIVHGCDQPSGYTEPILHAHRLKAKTTRR
jgi:malate synthase